MAAPEQELPPAVLHKPAVEVPQHPGNTLQQSNNDSAAAGNSALTAVGFSTALCRKPTKKLVGFDKERDKLKKMLTDVPPKGQPKIVYLVGSRGLGKTALAGAVYAELKPKFFEGSRAFVYVGQNPDMKQVYVDVLRQIELKNHHDSSDEDTACKYLRDYLSSARYFIVFDDIRNLQTWKKLRRALPTNSKYSGTVLVTTRDSEFYGNSGDNNVVKLERLSDDQANELFYRATFGDPEEYSDEVRKEHLAAVSKKNVLKKCGGVPLAILTVASEMECRSMNKWSDEYNPPDFCPTDADTIMKIIPQRILGLPSYLMPCLLYLSMLPDVDHWIEKDGLIWKWIAEGIVEIKEGKGLYEVGEGYFEELVKQRMIQRANRYDEKSFREGCRVHHVILDQIRLLPSKRIYVGVPGIEHCLPHRWLSVEGDISWRQMFSIQKIPEIVSLCASRCDHIDWIMLFSDFKALRVLDLVSSYLFRTIVPQTLPHLKYLGLAGTTDSFSVKMSSLQILDLRHTGLQNLNISAGMLADLRCLWCDDKTKVPDAWIKSLTSLEDLQVSSKSAEFLQYIGSLKQLRVLRIGLELGHMNDEEKIPWDSLGALENLTCLEIRCTSPRMNKRLSSDLLVTRLDHLRSLSLEGICLPTLPEWITPSGAPSLSRLAFAVEDMKVSDVHSLGELPELTCLNMVAGCRHPPGPGSSEQHQGQGGRGAFKKLRFCTTNVPPSRFFLSPVAATSLELLQFVVKVKDATTELNHALSPPNNNLEHVTILLDCWGASDSVKEAHEKEQELLGLVADNGNRPTLEVIREKQDAKLQVPLSTEYPQFHLFARPEIAKMLTNEENLRKIQLYKELDHLKMELSELEANTDDL